MKLKAIAVAPLLPSPGGGAISRGEILSGIARTGFEVCVIAPITSEALRDGDWFAARHPELRIVRYRLPEFLFDSQGPMNSAHSQFERDQICRLANDLIPTMQPDVLIAGREGLAAVTRKLAESHGLPWCLLLRGQPADDLVMGRLPDAAAAELLSHINTADLVIAVAQHIAENLRRRHNMRNVIWIPNAIDRDAFRPLQRTTASRVTLDLAPDRTIILLPGSLSRRKRPMDVLKAAQIVIRHRPDALFLLAGTGPLEDELIAYSNSQGLGDHVRFLGQIPHDHMPALFGVADAVIMASDSEGLSRVYLS